MAEAPPPPVPATPVEADQPPDAARAAAADSYEMYDQESSAEVLTEVANLENLNQVLQEYGFTVSEVELRWIPNNTVEVTDSEQGRSLIKLLDTLESLDDVQNVTANFEMSEELALASS